MSLSQIPGQSVPSALPPPTVHSALSGCVCTPPPSTWVGKDVSTAQLTCRGLPQAASVSETESMNRARSLPCPRGVAVLPGRNEVPHKLLDPQLQELPSREPRDILENPPGGWEEACGGESPLDGLLRPGRPVTHQQRGEMSRAVRTALFRNSEITGARGWQEQQQRLERV